MSEEAKVKQPYGAAFSLLCEGVTFSPGDQAISVYRLVDRIAAPTEPIMVNNLWYIAELHRNEEVSVQQFNSLGIELLVEVRGPSKTIEIAKVATNPFPVADKGSLVQRIIVPLSQTGFGFATFSRYYFEVFFSSPTHPKTRLFSAPIDVIPLTLQTPDQMIPVAAATPKVKTKTAKTAQRKTK
jgi:hypothetical protein